MNAKSSFVLKFDSSICNTAPVPHNTKEKAKGQFQSTLCSPTDRKEMPMFAMAFPIKLFKRTRPKTKTALMISGSN